MKKNGIDIIRVLGLIVLAALTLIYYRNTRKTERFSTGVTVNYERERTQDSSGYANEKTDSEQDSSNVSSDKAQEQNQEQSEDPSDDSVKIKKLRTGHYRDMFIREHNVEDYYGNSYSSALVAYGDGLIMDTFTKPVTFINNDGYTTITGEVVLAGDERTREGIQSGQMRIVLLDMNDHILQGSDWIRADTEKTSIIEFDIEGMKEFKIAVDATDGRRGGHNMKLIVSKDLVAIKE